MLHFATSVNTFTELGITVYGGKEGGGCKPTTPQKVPSSHCDRHIFNAFALRSCADMVGMQSC